ncbi:hypothetical protein NCS56_00376600 [Fusarium sp. Ph1]|nr:hypothetical protein NCS56_00376600 [Fusarium sp. Ph1]
MPTKVNPGDIPIAVGSSAGLEGAFDQANNAQVKEARNRCPAAFRDLLILNDLGVAKVAIFKQEMSKGEDKPAIDRPLIEGPVHVDYGFRINVWNFSNMLRNCIIIYTPFSEVRFGVNDKDGKPLTVGRKVIIGGCSWIGYDVVILPGIEIGHHSKVGDGSVVTESVPPYHYVKGNPAVVVKKFDKSIASGTEDVHFSDQIAEWGVKRSRADGRYHG